jgi:hypothetical protein
MRRAIELLSDAQKRKAMGEAGRKLCEAHRGATERHIAVCREVFQKQGQTTI